MSNYQDISGLSRKLYKTWIASYNQRKKITNLNVIKKSNSIKFKGVDEQGNHIEKKGLFHLYEYFDKNLGTCYIFDNHNHALYLWTMFYCCYRKSAEGNNDNQETLPVIHIDQHSDLKDPPTPINTEKIDDPSYMKNYIEAGCTVGSFIKPALNAGIISECKQVRSEFSLLELGETLANGEKLVTEENNEFILDIDLDFRDPAMGIQEFEKTLKITKQLMQKAAITTIATSPYFLDQDYAIKILKRLLN